MDTCMIYLYLALPEVLRTYQKVTMIFHIVVVKEKK